MIFMIENLGRLLVCATVAVESVDVRCVVGYGSGQEIRGRKKVSDYMGGGGGGAPKFQPTLPLSLLGEKS